MKQPGAGTKRLRDPRTLKLLDPACGSMHFGLYAFDLFAEIYREAWAWEQQHGPGCSGCFNATSSRDLKPLCKTYADKAAFLLDVPRLIIERNIYGVDIDPRAAQIASLALWLRAQRAWHEAGVNSQDRPRVGPWQCGGGHCTAGRTRTAQTVRSRASIRWMRNYLKRRCNSSRACPSSAFCCRSKRSCQA